MRLDFHTHGKLAKKLPFSTAYTDWLFGEARRAGLDALCLTEHFNTLQFADVYGYIASVSRRTGDTLELENGLKIFPGMETDVAEGGHILSIGPLEAILELNRRLEKHKEKGSFLPFEGLMDLFGDYPVVVGCGHPFRAGGHVPELPQEQLRRLRFLDLWRWTGSAPSGSPTPWGESWTSPWCPAATPIRRCSTAASPRSLNGMWTPSPPSMGR